MSGLSFDDVNKLILDAAGVPRGGSPGPVSKEVSPGIRPGQFQRGYISAGHQADSPANRRRAAPVAPKAAGGAHRCARRLRMMTVLGRTGAG
jgi:hypothetical protein